MDAKRAPILKSAKNADFYFNLFSAATETERR
jgi:hypothetical protein